ncbi:MAG: hypothetical protein K8W52_34200 [Deltaproteobacteria bacterium]|nr:hypothetical protein [Deltaproteobacteria bacterium]
MSSRPIVRALALALLAACGSSTPEAADARVGFDAPQPPDAAPVIDAAPMIDAVPFDNGATVVTATKVGDPAWEVADLRLYSAPMGTTQTNDFSNTLALMWPLHAIDTANNIIVPKTAHSGYATEVSEGLVGQALDPGNRFRVDEWTIPAGLYLSGVVVPTASAPVGKSADGASGPIIPNAVTLDYDGDLLLGTTVVDPDFDATSPVATSVTTGVDGWSHLPLNFAENTEFIAGTAGSYTFRIKIRETAMPANGWDIEVPFTVE